MIPARFLAAALVLGPRLACAADPGDAGIRWRVSFDAADGPPAAPWSPVGSASAAVSADGVLTLRDDDDAGQGHFLAPLLPAPGRELVIEARLRVRLPSESGGRSSLWPGVEGAPVTLVVGDGVHEGGLVFRPDRVASRVDRVASLDTMAAFRTYRMFIRGRDLRVEVDGVTVIRGEGAFSSRARRATPFVLFGSDSDRHRGEAQWTRVRVGERVPAGPAAPPRLRLTFSEPWEIPSAARGGPDDRPFEHLRPATRPYLYALGRGLLLMSVAQGPDAVLEPYGVLRSTDAGRTWQPVPGLQHRTFAPLPFARLPGGDIVGVSRWAVKYEREEGTFVGMTYRFDPAAVGFTLRENLIVGLPPGMGRLTFDRHLLVLDDGSLLVTAYGSATRQPGDERFTGRRSVLLRSADDGLTWRFFSTPGPRPEPAIARFSATEMTALLRVNGWMPLEQTWSADGGLTWSPPVRLEEGSVDPDLALMSHGVLACSYGRPGSNLMFSLDRGRTWIHHHVVTEERGYNYGSLQEVAPGRLLHVHDAPRLQARHIDVARLD